MKIKFLILGLLTFIVTNIFADGITIETARQVAKNFYFEKSGINQKEIIFEEEHTVMSENIAMYYIFNLEKGKGFVLVSADDIILPIIGYSLENTFKIDEQPENVAYFFQEYTDKIQYKIENNISSTIEIRNSWIKYSISSSEFTYTKNGNKEVSPLVNHIQWNQTDGWNDYCPSNSTGEKAVTGCVATAMGIIMKYHEYPASGNGTYTYTPDGYSEQTVDYGASNYSWSSMSNTSPTSQSAQLVYHAGVAVQMQYGSDGSSSYTIDVVDALWYYFLYQYPIYVKRSNYDDIDWITLLKEDLDAARPIFYSGNKTEGGGHAFICDGYDNSDLFHFNFGWGGYNNGFYSINDPQGYADGQLCIVGIEPDNSITAKQDRENSKKTNNNNLIEINIYPNPTNGIININCNEEINSVEIYDISGNLILKTSNSRNIDFTQNSTGIYFINIITSENIYIEKIVLQ